MQRALLGDRLRDAGVWEPLHESFAALIAGRHDEELAETYFNSATRKIFEHAGVIPGIEFLDYRKPPLPLESHRAPIFRRYLPVEGAEELIREILADLSFAHHFADLNDDARLAGRKLEEQLAEARLALRGLEAEVLAPVFFRNKGAYVVGRLVRGDRSLPFALALTHPDEGITVDAVLTRTAEVSVVFSFTRSYFHVEVEQHRELIAFLRSILPEKPVAELYTAIGHHKHGKTLLYRDLMRHLAESDDQFVFARGTRGLVMEVFTLPSYDVVFKVIRDRFPHPKRTTRERVMRSYHLVHRHDRVGRLVDAQEFEHLAFDRARFDPALLEELLRCASRTVHLEGDRVVIGHLYSERRVVPLDLYVREATEEAAREAVLDYGVAIKDLSAANIFPGDLLLKNFGVTRNRRAVFYDYDEISLLTDCNFREVPQARSWEDELENEPWFPIAENDVFPEEFPRFLGLAEPLRSEFTRAHGDLFTCAYWRRMQERTREGELVDVIPYREESRIRPASA